MQASLATIARFFRIGIELGVCEPGTVRAWAISVIERVDDPPGGIIEASYRKPVSQMIEDLNDVCGEVDLAVIRGRLVYELWKSLSNSVDSLDRIARQGMQLAISVQDGDLYRQFSWIDDVLQLAVSGTYGTVEECRWSWKKS